MSCYWWCWLLADGQTREEGLAPIDTMNGEVLQRPHGLMRMMDGTSIAFDDMCSCWQNQMENCFAKLRGTRLDLKSGMQIKVGCPCLNWLLMATGECRKCLWGQSQLHKTFFCSGTIWWMISLHIMHVPVLCMEVVHSIGREAKPDFKGRRGKGREALRRVGRWNQGMREGT